MIDTWLLAALCFFLLFFGALFRVFRTRNRFDRYLSEMVAVMIGSAAGLLLSIAAGTLFILDITIILAIACIAGIIVQIRFTGGAQA